MLQIDFLPQEYRQRHARRNVKPWRHIVVVAVLCAVAGLASVQRIQRQRVQRELTLVSPLYEQVIGQQKRLADVQTQLRRAKDEANVYAYLRHPWPKTQLLAAVLKSVPTEVRIEQLGIVREAIVTATPAGLPETRPRSNATPEDQTKLSPDERDLRRLRAEYDKLRTVIHLSGSTSDSASLHAYFAELGRLPLFAKAEIESLETTEIRGAATVRFRATVCVRNGYGQAGGPAASPGATLAQGAAPPAQP